VSNVRKFMPVNRLAKMFRDANGLLVSQALDRASANVEEARPRYLAALNGKLDALREHAPQAGDELYRLAREVFADAGALRLSHLSRAALSLCDLLASNTPQPRLGQGVAVHVEAIMALRDGSEPDPHCEAIVKGLFAISSRRP
jgi:hypothetical protein